MQQSYGVGYEEYSRQLKERMKVEKEREMDYKRGQIAIMEIEHSVYK